MTESCTITPEQNQALDELIDSSSKYKAFVNGPEGSFVQTDSGLIPTLASVIKDLKTLRYAQPIKDYETLADAIADVPNLDVGSLVRIYGDLPAVNGLYEVKPLGVLEKTDYQSISDLYDLLRNPYNFNTISLNTTNTSSTLELGTVTIPVSGNIADVDSKFINVDVQYTVISPNKSYRYKSDINLTASISTESYNAQNVYSETKTVIDNDGPVISVSYQLDNVNNNHIFTVNLDANVPGFGRVDVYSDVGVFRPAQITP